MRDILQISRSLRLKPEEIELSAIRAGGPGGQHVNKSSSAIHLRYNIHTSSLPPHYKARLLALGDRRISRDGVIVIKAEGHRVQERNRQEAIGRLARLIAQAGIETKPRKSTRPSRNSIRRGKESKMKRGRLKALRRRVESHSGGD